MAAPMTPAAPTRSQQITARENAIKKRLEASNNANKVKATSQVSSEIAKLKAKKKHGVRVKTYNTERIRGAKDGFSRSDYGVGEEGAGIPYQIATDKGVVSKSTDPPKKPKLPKLPKPKSTAPRWTEAAGSARANAIVRRAAAAGNKVKGL